MWLMVLCTAAVIELPVKAEEAEEFLFDDFNEADHAEIVLSPVNIPRKKSTLSAKDISLYCSILGAYVYDAAIKSPYESLKKRLAKSQKVTA